MKLFCSNYWRNPQITAAVYYFQKQPPEMFCKQGVINKNSKIHRKVPMLESLFNKVTGPEACFPVNFAQLLSTRFYKIAPVAPTDYSELYNFVSNLNGTSLVKENCLDFTRT